MVFTFDSIGVRGLQWHDQAIRIPTTIRYTMFVWRPATKAAVALMGGFLKISHGRWVRWLWRSGVGLKLRIPH